MYSLDRVLAEEAEFWDNEVQKRINSMMSIERRTLLKEHKIEKK